MYYDYDDGRASGDDYDDRPRRRAAYRCGGFADYDGPCGASDCSRCGSGDSDEDEDEESDEARFTERTTVRTIRKARKDTYGNLMVFGDRVMVVKGFTYEVGGRRTGYYTRERKYPSPA